MPSRPTALLFPALMSLLAATPAIAQSGAGGLESFNQRSRELAAQVGPAVVQIFTTSFGAVSEGETGLTDFGTFRRTGSGVVIDPSGFIVTNAHVVDQARRVQILLAADGKPQDDSAVVRRSDLKGARVVGIDRETDIAVIKVDAGRPLPILAYGDSDALRQGDVVYAFGSPLGLNNSISLGVVSAVSRQLEDDAAMVYIQTDAAVNPGNSGGPLVNIRGELVGINTMIYSQGGGSEGIGFAAPSNIVRGIAEQLRNFGRVHRGVIGVFGQTIDPWLAKGLRLPVNRGVILGDVAPDGPAATAGLQIGDIIVSLDGVTLVNARQFTASLASKPIGKPVTLEIVRGDKKSSKQVTVVERVEPALRFLDLVSRDRNLIPRLGILGLELTRETAVLLPRARRNDGVIVASLTRDSDAMGDLVQTGDIIYAVNGQTVRKLDDLRRLIQAVGFAEVAVLQVERGGRLRYLTMEFS